MPASSRGPGHHPFKVKIASSNLAAGTTALLLVDTISDRHDNAQLGGGFHITRPSSAADWSDAVALIDEYAQSLAIDLSFQNLHKEIGDPAAQYSPPDGAFFLARIDGQLAGCAALRRFDATSGEMKRLYVRPSGRGRGIGRTLAELVVNAAIAAGYQHIVLDTLASMTSAQAIYRSLGFEETPAYRFNPVPGAVYMRLDLAGLSRSPRSTP
jgi:putative acetyltransferase